MVLKKKRGREKPLLHKLRNGPASGMGIPSIRVEAYTPIHAAMKRTKKKSE